MSRRAANQMASVSDRQLDAAEMSAALARADALLRAAAGAVFCIACANVTMLLLARGSARAHETATRVALGCARHHLAQQLFADSLIVALAGGAAGALLAPWTVWIIAGAVLPGGCAAFDVRARPARDRGGVRHLRLRDDRVLTRADLGARYFADVERAVATRPHVATTAWAATLPGSPPVVQSMRIEPRAAQVRDVVADALPFTRELLAQVAARPIAGRMFAGADTADACRVVLLNARAAQMMFAGDAVGRAIVDAEGTRLEVVGVVATKPPHADAPAVPMVYHYADQMPPPFGRRADSVPSGGGRTGRCGARHADCLAGLLRVDGTLARRRPPASRCRRPDACRVAVVNREAADRYLDGNAVGAAVIGDGRRAEIAGELGIGFVLPARRALGIDPWSILAERRSAISSSRCPAAREYTRPMAGLLADARLALRALRRSPGFSVTVVLTLGIAIGVNTAVFTVTRAVLFKGFRGIAKNDRLVYIGTQRQGRGCCASYPDIVDWRAQAQSFRDIAAVADRQIVVADVNRSAEHYDATQISPNAFRLLGRQPILGRDFVASDGDLGAPAVAILQYQFWQRRYAGDDAVLGRTIVINGVPTTIIGVMPEDFAFPQNQDLWLPLIPTAEMQRRDNRGLWFAFGRLRDGATIESARAELAAIGQRLSIAYPTTNKGWVPQPRTFAEFFVGRDAATIYGTLWAAVGFVLLIACANVSNLVLSRGLARAREWSLLTALGASRWRIVRRQLVESAMLSFAGGVGGWWIARLCVRAYEASANPPARAWSARLFDYGMDARVLVYIVAACGATTVLSGLWPSVHLSRVDGSTVIEDSGRSVAGSRRGRRLSTALVALEVATAAVLLVAAGVMVRSFANMARADLGIRPANLHAMLVNLPHDRYADQASQTRFFERLTAGLRNTDEVESIALTDRLPAEDGRRVPYELTTHPNDAEHRDTVLTVTIGPGYFDVIGAAVRAGRDFNPFDLPSAPPVAIVNQRFAEMEWPNEDPIGRRLRLFDERGSGPWLVVVGVASNVTQNVRDRKVKDAVIYRPYSQRPASGLWVVARTHPWVPHIAAAFRSAIDAIDPDVPIWVGPLSLDALMAAMGSYWLLGSNTAMFAAFAAIALFLASLGIYAVVAYSVSRRTREFGIRLAIGARRRDVLVLVLREHVRPIGVGLASGLAASLALVPILRSQLVHVSAADPIAVFVASAVLLASALVGCLLPAYRATTIGPAIALRGE